LHHLWFSPSVNVGFIKHFARDYSVKTVVRILMDSYRFENLCGFSADGAAGSGNLFHHRSIDNGICGVEVLILKNIKIIP
jgi:hypothetical protein